jgi:hypothetical protein
MVTPVTPSNNMDTSKQIKHVFGCLGPTLHLTPGFKLLRAADPTKCPECGADVYDATDTTLGQLYLRDAGFTRGDLPS